MSGVQKSTLWGQYCGGRARGLRGAQGACAESALMIYLDLWTESATSEEECAARRQQTYPGNSPEAAQHQSPGQWLAG
jgi:hypothetical protein